MILSRIKKTLHGRLELIVGLSTLLFPLSWFYRSYPSSKSSNGFFLLSHHICHVLDQTSKLLILLLKFRGFLLFLCLLSCTSSLSSLDSSTSGSKFFNLFCSYPKKVQQQITWLIWTFEVYLSNFDKCLYLLLKGKTILRWMPRVSSMIVTMDIWIVWFGKWGNGGLSGSTHDNATSCLASSSRSNSV